MHPNYSTYQTDTKGSTGTASQNYKIDTTILISPICLSETTCDLGKTSRVIYMIPLIGMKGVLYMTGMENYIDSTEYYLHAYIHI